VPVQLQLANLLQQFVNSQGLGEDCGDDVLAKGGRLSGENVCVACFLSLSSFFLFLSLSSYTFQFRDILDITSPIFRRAIV
jgi:hypothetical protein